MLLPRRRLLSAVQDNAESFGPLTPAMFHVLLALAGDDLHGYAILKEVELRTGGKVRLSTGTLYGIIKRLLSDGLIVELRSRPAESNDDERRRYYRVKKQGVATGGRVFCGYGGKRLWEFSGRRQRSTWRCSTRMRDLR